MSTTLPVLGLVLVGLRFFSRRLQKARLWIDDWLMIPAEILLITISIFTIIGVHGHAFGYLALPASNENLETIQNTTLPVEILASKIATFFMLFQPLQLGFVKLSILFFYRRIFCGGYWAGMGWATGFTIAITILWSLSFFVAYFFNCGTDFKANWGPMNEEVKDCIHTNLQLLQAQTYSNFIIDIMILIMPIYSIWKLHLSKKRRLSIVGILALGVLTIIVSFIRVLMAINMVHDMNLLGLFYDIVDPDMVQAILIYWALLESGFATMVACLPTLPTVARRVPDLLRTLRKKISVDVPDHTTTTHSRPETNETDNLEAGLDNEACSTKEICKMAEGQL